MRAKKTPSITTAPRRCVTPENQLASNAQIALGAKKMVHNGQYTSNQNFSHTSRNFGSPISNTPMLRKVSAPTPRGYVTMNEGDNEANTDRKTTIAGNEADDHYEHEDLQKH